MQDLHKWEADGFFGLSYRESARWSGGGDLGTGGGVSTVRFTSDEGRAYFIQSMEYKEKATELAARLEWLKNDLRKVLTPSGRIRRKRLLKIIEDCTE